MLGTQRGSPHDQPAILDRDGAGDGEGLMTAMVTTFAREPRSEEKKAKCAIGRGLGLWVKPKMHGPKKSPLRMRYLPGRTARGLPANDRPNSAHG